MSRQGKKRREKRMVNVNYFLVLQGITYCFAAKEREQALCEFYEGKMQHLTVEVKASDAKAVQLFEQRSSLLKALEDKEAERNFLLERIKVANQETRLCREDLGILFFSPFSPLYLSTHRKHAYSP
jgi:hypothetical protein